MLTHLFVFVFFGFYGTKAPVLSDIINPEPTGLPAVHFDCTAVVHGSVHKAALLPPRHLQQSA